MNCKKHEWQRRIRHEFEAPAKIVITSYSESGYSKRLTAASIGITMQTLVNYCRRENINFPNRSQLRSECKPHGNGWPKGKKRIRQHKYSDEYLLDTMIKYDFPAHVFDLLAPIPASTIIRRFGSWSRAKMLSIKHNHRITNRRFK